ncbi:MAG: hypothetical protein H5U08_18375 [Thermogutta sp.]|nr:hypothetical protein [Thermogutta sp.]
MHIDLVPTILAAVGLEIPEHLDGVNLLPYWLGEKQEAPHEILFWGLPPKRYAARAGNWKLVVREGVPELYDLANDPHEERNVAADHPEVVHAMLEQAEAWQRRTGRLQADR